MPDLFRKVNPFDYIKPGAVLTRDSLPASNETDNDALVEEGMKVMGFFKRIQDGSILLLLPQNICFRV